MRRGTALASVAGTHLRNLTDDASQRNWGPSWSPDGTRIAFNRSLGWTPPTLWVMDSDGGGARQLTDRWAEYPKWSPDGRSLAFESRGDGNYEIYRVDVDGTGLTRLTDTPQDDKAVTWSPDGRRLLFASERDGSRSSLSEGRGFEARRQVYAMMADGSQPRRVLADRLSEEMPRWTPDGEIVFFAVDLAAAGAYAGAFLLGADGSHPRRLSYPYVELDWIR